MVVSDGAHHPKHPQVTAYMPVPIADALTIRAKILSSAPTPAWEGCRYALHRCCARGDGHTTYPDQARMGLDSRNELHPTEPGSSNDADPLR